ncbi:MAG: c-type cytochrome biogenesis protein CcmI, partial [Pseudomonadota bacterium]|nr:c-type cytochrome biogenesis protein CcmI [Pseudomonadota bacterium]
QSARQLLSSLLQDEPDNSNLVLMLAVVAGRLGDEAVLASNLSKLDGLLPADNPLMVQLQSRLTQIRGETPESASEAQQLTGFNIEISISDELAAKLPENGFLFVFAQDANSDNRMPAAVLRMPLSTLPATVTLTQENAMTPNYSLAQLSEVKLMARVSADQEAPAVTGDLEGVMNSEVVQGNILDATIVINKEIM